MKRFPHKHIRWERVAHCFFSTEGLARAGLLGWAALLKEAKWLGVRLSQAQATGNFYFAVDQYLRIKSAPVSSAAPVLRCAPAPAGRRVSRNVVRDFAAGARMSRSSLSGRSIPRKKFLVITLAASSTASGSVGFRLRTRSR